NHLTDARMFRHDEVKLLRVLVLVCAGLPWKMLLRHVVPPHLYLWVTSQTGRAAGSAAGRGKIYAGLPPDSLRCCDEFLRPLPDRHAILCRDHALRFYQLTVR